MKHFNHDSFVTINDRGVVLWESVSKTKRGSLALAADHDDWLDEQYNDLDFAYCGTWFNGLGLNADKAMHDAYAKRAKRKGYKVVGVTMYVVR